MERSNKIFIRDLRVDMNIGILPHELGGKQVLLVNADVFLDQSIQWNHDDVRETVRYDDLTARINAIAAQKHFNLIETFLEKIADDFLGMNKVKAVKISALKPGIIKGVDSVGVEIIRKK